jgi:hypothetical protein
MFRDSGLLEIRSIARCINYSLGILIDAHYYYFNDQGISQTWEFLASAADGGSYRTDIDGKMNLSNFPSFTSYCLVRNDTIVFTTHKDVLQGLNCLFRHNARPRCPLEEFGVRTLMDIWPNADSLWMHLPHGFC